MTEEWIDWNAFTPPDDVKGIFIKYMDGSTFWDLYNPDGSRHHKRDNPIGWKFMERKLHDPKTIQPFMDGYD